MDFLRKGVGSSRDCRSSELSFDAENTCETRSGHKRESRWRYVQKGAADSRCLIPGNVTTGIEIAARRQCTEDFDILVRQLAMSIVERVPKTGFSFGKMSRPGKYIPRSRARSFRGVVLPTRKKLLADCNCLDVLDKFGILELPQNLPCDAEQVFDGLCSMLPWTKRDTWVEL